MRFDDLAETLLRGGIAPKHVHRYIAELRDHADDLMRAGLSEGLSKAEAEHEALRTLGSVDTLAAEMLQRRDLMSLGARYPISFYGAGPALALCASYLGALLIIATSISVCNLILGKAELIAATNLHVFVDAYCRAVRYILPALVGLGFVVSAMRQRANLTWLVIGIVIISFIGATADMSVIPPPDLNSPGELGFGFGLSSPKTADMGPTLRRGLINLGLVIPAFAWLWVMRRRDQRVLNSSL